jgi:Ni,Fe-hydrogenase III large subunit
MPKPTGDVYARARVRADEVMQSIAIIESLLPEPVATGIVDVPEPACPGARFPGGHPQ